MVGFVGAQISFPQHPMFQGPIDLIFNDKIMIFKDPAFKARKVKSRYGFVMLMNNKPIVACAHF